MRFALFLSILTLSVSALAQMTGSETVTSQNAPELGFSLELTERDAGTRVRLFIPSTISNGFNYAYTGVFLHDSSEKLVMSSRPETSDDLPSRSKFVDFVAAPGVLPCFKVRVTYLDPERPMHSDYLMEIDLSTFLEGSPRECTI